MKKIIAKDITDKNGQISKPEYSQVGGYTTLKDVANAGYGDIKKVDVNELKKKANALKDNTISKLKAFDEKVSKMSRDDFVKILGLKTKDDAIEYLNRTYTGTVPEETRKKIDKHLNKIYNSKGFQYTQSRANAVYEYAKNTDKEQFNKDVKSVKKAIFKRFKKTKKLIESKSKEDLYTLGLDNKDKAVAYFAELYGKHDIKSLRKLEKIIEDKYKAFDKEEAKNTFKNFKDSFENKKKGFISASKAKYKSIKRYLSVMSKKDFIELGIDNANDALRYILKQNPDISKSEIKRIYKDLDKIFKTIDKTKDIGSETK
jgi:hypothetical protein